LVREGTTGKRASVRPDGLNWLGRAIETALGAAVYSLVLILGLTLLLVALDVFRPYPPEPSGAKDSPA